MEETHFVEPKMGDVILARVVMETDEGWLMDIGAKQEALLPEREAGRVGKRAKPNEEFKVKVIGRDPNSEQFFVSRRLVEQENLWEEFEEDKRRGTIRTGKVIKAVEKGLIVDIGYRAFLPQSHIDFKPVRNLQDWYGKEIEVKIIEVEPERSRIVVSRRLVLEEQQNQHRKARMEEIQPGSVLTGRVAKIVSFGAFIDLGSGVQGLLHATQIAWGRNVAPSSCLKVGDEIQVKVLSKDVASGRVSLSLKALTQDPWDDLAKRVHVGDVLEGVVSQIARKRNGVFVKIADGVEGWVHISELSDDRVRDPEEVLKVGQKVQVKVLEFSAPQRRLRLSIKGATAVEEKSDAYYQSADGQASLGDFWQKSTPRHSRSDKRPK